MNGIRYLTFGLIPLLLAASGASASDGYVAPELEASQPWRAILYLLVGLAGVAVVGFKNSKRTHLS